MKNYSTQFDTKTNYTCFLNICEGALRTRMQQKLISLNDFIIHGSCRGRGSNGAFGGATREVDDVQAYSSSLVVAVAETLAEATQHRGRPSPIPEKKSKLLDICPKRDPLSLPRRFKEKLERLAHIL